MQTSPTSDFYLVLVIFTAVTAFSLLLQACCLLVMAIVLYIMIRYSQGVLFPIALAYTFSGIWARAAYGWSRRRRHGQRTDAPSLSDGPSADPDPHHS